MKTSSLVARFAIMCFVLAHVQPAAAQGRCRQQCEQARESHIHDYEACAERAASIKDPLMAVKHKSNCRKQFPLLECSALPVCDGEQAKIDEAGKSLESMTMNALNFSGGKKGLNYASNQTVEVQYHVKVNKKGQPNLWFDQDLTVYDMHGNQVLELQDSFERSGEMVTSYNFTSSFVIPEELPSGQYKLRIQVREKFTRWQGQQEETFSISGKKPAAKGA